VGVRTATTIVALLALVVPGPQSPTIHVLNAHFKPSGPRYEYVPFALPAGVEMVTISYRYSGDDGSSVIDLGLFEPGPLTIGTAAFRGYSGGAQRTITVGRNTASPGYEARPLPAGLWHVMLGMYKVAPAGVDVTITVTEVREEPSAGPSAAPKGPALQPPPSAGPGHAPGGPVVSDLPKWYSGALHLHTIHSDGVLTPAALADTARDAGYDFIAITDHNNTTHTRDPLPASPLHIVGEEVTTPGGHANVWGLPKGAWIDFRVSPGEPGAADTINGWVDAAHKAGALFAISHPFDTCGGCSWEQTIPGNLDGLEIWNGAKGPQEPAIAMWDRLLRAGRRVTAVGASDWHRPPTPIGAAAVRVLAPQLTEAAILDGIRQHRVIVMRDARTPPPSVQARCGSNKAGVGDTLTCRADDELAVQVSMPDQAQGNAEFSLNAARLTTRAIGSGTTLTMPAAAGYLRVRVYAADGSTVAITNPVYVQTR
jgi:hypothetical protein